MDFYPYHYSSGSNIRLCIFLSTSVCVGLPALVWASCLLDLHRKIRGQISAFNILLLLSDLIQLLLNLYIVTQLLIDLYWYLNVIFQFWTELHWCGIQLHQLVTLERVLTLKYPFCSARICSLPCYIIIFIVVLVFSIPSTFFFFMLPLVSTPILFFSIGTSLVPLSLLALTNLIICKASSTPVSKNTHSLNNVAFVTFFMLCLSFMLVIYASLFTVGGVHPSWYVMSACLMSLRVISDPILCVLVCRGNLRHVQTPQTNKHRTQSDLELLRV